MLRSNNNFLSGITFYVLIAVVVELAIGGGGRIFAIGPISLRMVLFAAAMVLSGIHLLRGEKIPVDYRNLLIAFALLMTGSLVIGIMHGSEKQYWWEDVKPLLYFLMLPFFSFAIAGISAVSTVSQIIKICSIILAIAFFLVLIFIHTGIISFIDFYGPATNTTEFFFRGETTFFYKGFLYLCIGFIFIGFTQANNKVFLLILLCLAILLSFTRGFIFALMLTYAVYFLLNNRKKWIPLAVCLLSAAGVLVSGKALIGHFSKVVSSFEQVEENSFTVAEKAEQSQTRKSAPDPTLFGDREYSDSARIDQIREVFSRVTFVSFFVGHGLGVGISIRPVHMEISYLEIFHKQGILGLIFWAILLFALIKKYRAMSAIPEANAFFFSALFVFIESLTNQFINNPIGLSMLLMAMVALDCLRKFSARDPDYMRQNSSNKILA